MFLVLVVNLSNRSLNQQETHVLQRGLKRIPVAKILASVESGILNLKDTEKQEIRLSVTNILKNAQPAKKRNITPEEEKALKDLKKDESIVILPADKGNAVVIENRPDYDKKIQDLLMDELITRSRTREEIQHR